MGTLEKSPILLSQLTKIISHFDGNNNIFVDCKDKNTEICN